MDLFEDFFALKSGWLKEKSPTEKDWSIRFFALCRNGKLLSFPKKLNPGEQVTATVYVATDCQVIVPKRAKDDVFIARVSYKGVSTTIFLEAYTAEEREEWLEALSMVCRSGNCTEKIEKTNFIDFNFLNLLYQGSIAKTYFCRNIVNSKFYAAKIYPKNHNNIYKEIAKDKWLLKKFDHPFITKLHYTFQTERHIYLMMDFEQGGTLAAHLYRKKVFTEDASRLYAAEIVLAIGFLHSHNIIHRDVRLENILLDRDGHIKISDLGLCKVNAEHGKNYKGFCGSIKYMTPEFVENGTCSFATDWWNLGFIVYRMLTGLHPFWSKHPQRCHGNVVTSFLKVPKTVVGQAREILYVLLEKNPEVRLGSGPARAAEVRCHPWFFSINWDHMYDKKGGVPFDVEFDSESDLRNYNTVYKPENVVAPMFANMMKLFKDMKDKVPEPIRPLQF